MKETGLRIGDVLALKVKDITNPLEVYEHKTKKTRAHTISGRLLDELSAHVKGRHSSWYAFASPRTNKKHLHRSTYHRRLKRALAGLHFDCSAHSNRKLFAQNIFAENKNIFDVQKALGHKYITATTSYLDIDLIQTIANAANQTQTPTKPPTLRQKINSFFKKLFRKKDATVNRQ